MTDAYILVHFMESQDIELVPVKWMINEVTCTWPPYNTAEKLSRAIVRCEPQQSTWQHYKVKKLCKNTSKICLFKYCLLINSDYY